MMLRMTIIITSLLPCPALACNLCGGDLQTRATLRQEIEKARVIVAGKLTNPQLNARGDGGTTELVVERTFKDPTVLKGTSRLTLPYYLPTDEKSARFLLTADVKNGRPEFLSGRLIKDERIIDYVKAITELNEPDAAK